MTEIYDDLNKSFMSSNNDELLKLNLFKEYYICFNKRHKKSSFPLYLHVKDVRNPFKYFSRILKRLGTALPQ